MEVLIVNEPIPADDSWLKSRKREPATYWIYWTELNLLWSIMLNASLNSCTSDISLQKCQRNIQVVTLLLFFCTWIWSWLNMANTLLVALWRIRNVYQTMPSEPTWVKYQSCRCLVTRSSNFWVLANIIRFPPAPFSWWCLACLQFFGKTS